MCIAIEHNLEVEGSKMDGLVKDEILAMDKPDCCGTCEHIWDDVQVQSKTALQLEQSKMIPMPADWEIGISKISAQQNESLLLAS